jgi:hypothetical protein
MTRTQSVAALVLAALFALLVAYGVASGALVSRVDADALGGAGADLPPGHPPISDLVPEDDSEDAGGIDDPPIPDDEMAQFDTSDGAPGVFSAEPGQCFADADASEQVPCSEPHVAEVFYTYEVDADEFPGEDAFGEQRCLDMMGAYVGTTYDASGYGVSWLVPSQGTWDELGDREVICMLVTDEPTVGSAYQSVTLVA